MSLLYKKKDEKIINKNINNIDNKNNFKNNISKDKLIIKNKKTISNIPFKVSFYNNLLKELLNNVSEHKDGIKVTPKNNNTKYDNYINSYIKDLENKIIIMKKAYLYTLIKKKYCNDENIRRKVLIQENISEKRNNVQKCFNELISFIQNNLQKNEEDQKYYYMLIINILTKYSNISNEEIQMVKQLYQENRLDTLNEVKKNINFNENKNKKTILFRNNSLKKEKISKIFYITIPLLCIASYVCSNFMHR